MRTSADNAWPLLVPNGIFHNNMDILIRIDGTRKIKMNCSANIGFSSRKSSTLILSIRSPGRLFLIHKCLYPGQLHVNAVNWGIKELFPVWTQRLHCRQIENDCFSTARC